jgi:hypothetical protein
LEGNITLMASEWPPLTAEDAATWRQDLAKWTETEPEEEISGFEDDQ